MKFNENQTTINFNQTITHTFGEWWSASYTELFNFVRSFRKNLPTDSVGHYFNRFEEARTLFVSSIITPYSDNGLADWSMISTVKSH